MLLIPPSSTFFSSAREQIAKRQSASYQKSTITLGGAYASEYLGIAIYVASTPDTTIKRVCVSSNCSGFSMLESASMNAQ